MLRDATATAFAAAAGGGGFGDGHKVAVPNQIAAHAGAPVDNGQGQAVAGLLHLQRAQPWLAGADGAAAATAHVVVSRARMRINL